MLINIEDKGTFDWLHVQDTRSHLEMCARLREDSQRGFTQDRTMQRYASIPMLEWIELTELRPELKDPKELEKWVNNDEVGRLYKTAPEQRRTHAGIIVK